LRWTSVLAPVLLVACASPGSTGSVPTAERRAILVSFDALNEERVRSTLPAESIPTFLSFFGQASCADGARPMWPSVTAASHAAIWTGAYGDVNGVVANMQVPLPWSEFSLTELRSGFEPRELTAEPIWISAGRAGRTVAGHHVTQAGEPGRWLPIGGRDTAAVRRDSVALATPGVFVVNGFTGGAGPRVLTERRNAPQPTSSWRGVEELGSIGVPLREVSWLLGRDSLHALFFGAGAYTEVVVSPRRDAARGVRVRPAAVEREPITGRELARHFSDVLWLGSEDGRGGVYFRLWDLAPDLSSYQLFHTGRAVIRSNQPEALAAYEDAVGGFVGDPSYVVLRDAGPTLAQGGDGTAEYKFLETTELQTRQFMRGSEWLWRTRRPALQADYFSLGDGIDHEWLGAVSMAVPGQNAALAARINTMRARGWALVDRRLAGLLELARAGNTMILVTGDHGMRATWKNFHVNTVLRSAGLLAVDTAGRPDLARTQAISPAGYFINVNRVERKGGIVPAERVEEVAQAAAAALLAARDPEGRPIVTRIWRPQPNDTLGIGGPAGGEVYFGLAPGYYPTAAPGDSVVTARTARGAHGFPSIDPDMRSAFCALGPGIGGRRLPTVRVIDAAPTVSAWLGIPPPADARGMSLLEAMRTPAP
jgi:hypothetical protein